MEVPKEMQNPNNSPQLPTKQYAEDNECFKSMFLDELRTQKNLIEDGNDDSISGSDDAPSEDNMTAEELCQVIPAVDKKLKNALKKLKNKEKSKNDKNGVTKKTSVKSNKTQDTSDLDKAKKSKKDDKKNEKKKPIMVDAWTQTEKSDYSLIKYNKMHKHRTKTHAKMIGQEHYTPNHSGILSNSGYRKGYEKQISNSFKGVSYVPNNYKNGTNMNYRTMREEKSIHKVRDGIGNLKSHSNARGYKNTFYDSINSGVIYKDRENNRGGSIGLQQRRKSKRGAEMMKQAYHTEEVKYHQQSTFYSAQKPNSRLHKSKLRQNQPHVSDIRKSLTRKKISDSNSIRRDQPHTGKWTGKKLGYVKKTDDRIYGSSKTNNHDSKYKSPPLNANSSKLLMKTTVGVFDQGKAQNTSNITLRNPISASGSKNANFRIRSGKTGK